MKKILSIQIFIFFSLISFGQIKPIDLNFIKSLSTKDYYNKLFNRYLINDTTLTIDDYQIIYYGQAFQDNYKPNARHDSVGALNTYLNNNIDQIDFNKVLNYTKQILNDFPFNIEDIYITGVAYDKLGIADSSKVWFYKYDKLIKTIMYSGDGKTKETAFIVTKVADEYSVIDAFGFKPKGQALINKDKKYYDSISISRNKYGIENLYFDINLFFGKW